MLAYLAAAYLAAAAPAAQVMPPQEVAKLYEWMMSDDPAAANIICQHGHDVTVQGHKLHTMVCITGPADEGPADDDKDPEDGKSHS